MGDIQSDSLDMDLLIRSGSSFGPGPSGLHFGPVLRSLGVVLGASLLWAWLVGLRTYFSNPISRPPALVYVSVGKGCNSSRIGCSFHVSIRGWVS